jgi:hypothetical protein
LQASLRKKEQLSRRGFFCEARFSPNFKGLRLPKGAIQTWRPAPGGSVGLSRYKKYYLQGVDLDDRKFLEAK